MIKENNIHSISEINYPQPITQLVEIRIDIKANFDTAVIGDNLIMYLGNGTLVATMPILNITNSNQFIDIKKFNKLPSTFLLSLKDSIK